MSDSSTSHMLSPSKITAWMACEHYLTLKFKQDNSGNRFTDSFKRDEDDALIFDERGIPVIEIPTDFSDLLQKKGILHEQECLKIYKDTYGENNVFEVPGLNEESFEQWVERAIVPNPFGGYPIIFQMPFIYRKIRGIADFLEQQDDTYEPVDSKLSRSGAKSGHLLQLLFYAEAVENSPGISKRPNEVHVDLGSGRRDSFKVSEFWWYWNRLRGKLEEVVEIGEHADTKPKKCSYCGLCEFYWTDCEPLWRGEDSLTFLAGIHPSHKEALEESGITTLKGLASLPKKTLQVLIEKEQDSETPLNVNMEEKVEEDFLSVMPEVNDETLIETVPEIKVKQLVRLWRQARLQTITYLNGYEPKDARVHIFSADEMKEKMGEKGGWKRRESLLHLPESTDHDIYLDFEGHPFLTAESEIIFLFGYIEKIKGEWRYQELWAEDEDGYPNKDVEKEQAKNLVEMFYQRHLKCMKDGVQMHVYHYNHTERSLLGNLTTDTDQSSNIVDVFGQQLSKSRNVEDLSAQMHLEELVEKGVFVDLLAVVRNSLQAGLESYSLKLMEQLAGFDRQQNTEVSGTSASSEDNSSMSPEDDGSIQKGAGAVYEYELYANHKNYGIPRDESRKKAIAKYNEEDVVATRYLHEWLLKKRRESEHLREADTELPEELIPPKGVVAERIEELQRKILGQVGA